MLPLAVGVEQSIIFSVNPGSLKIIKKLQKKSVYSIFTSVYESK